jgi:hypothetical protein
MWAQYRLVEPYDVLGVTDIIRFRDCNNRTRGFAESRCWNEGMASRQTTTWFLIAVAGVALYLCYRLAEPFLNLIFAAILLAIVF